MKKIKCQIEVQAKPELKEIEIALPLYKHHDCGGDSYDADIYYRIDENLQIVELHKNYSWGRDTTSWELKVKQLGRFNTTGSDYDLGQGEYACTAEKFNEVFKEFTDTIASINKV